MNHAVFKKSLNKVEEEPVIVMGDFNAPSHLDWIEANKDLHGGWSIDWPTSKLLTDNVKMIDSFRTMHSDPIKEPGLSWSPVQKFLGPEWNYTIPMPQDRVDFIYYRGSGIEPVKSFMYAGTEDLKTTPNQWKNDYPSDHYAIVTDFATRNEKSKDNEVKGYERK